MLLPFGDRLLYYLDDPFGLDPIGSVAANIIAERTKENSKWKAHVSAVCETLYNRYVSLIGSCDELGVHANREILIVSVFRFYKTFEKCSIRSDAKQLPDWLGKRGLVHFPNSSSRSSLTVSPYKSIKLVGSLCLVLLPVSAVKR